MQNAKRNAKEFGDASEKAADKAEKAFSNLKSTIIGLGIGQALKTSITDAMNAVESESLFEVSLGNYASKARAWSEEMSNALGLDPYALRQNLGVMQTLVTRMGLADDAAYKMSTSLVMLSEDMASFYNLSPEEAFGKLRSAITGEFEPMKALGYVLNESMLEQVAYQNGIAKTGEKLNATQKALATYTALMEQSTTVQGDLARTMNSPSNQLRATMNELKQASIEFGMALMPIVQTALPILRDVIEDIKPVAMSTATGLSIIGSTLQLLESPAARGIAYIALATAALKKLNMSLGSTMTGLLLIGSVLTYIIGEYSTAEEKADDVASKTFDGASIAADGAKESTDKFAKSLGEAGKAAARLAGFDEITKLSGGSSGNLGAQFYEAADAAETATNFVAEYENALASVSDGNWTVSPELDLSKVDWSRLQADIKQITDDLDAIFTGNADERYADERYAALKRLTEKIEDLFGAEWTQFWQGVGNDIFSAFNDFGSVESYQALYNLNERIKSIPFMETFQNIGKAFGEGLANISAGIDKFLSGDFEAAGELFNDAMGKTDEVVVDVIDNTPLGKFLGIPGQLAKVYAQNNISMREADAAKDKEFREKLNEMEESVKAYISAGYSPEVALSQAKMDYYDSTSMFGGEFVEWYQKQPEDVRLERKVESWSAEVDSNNLATPATAADFYSIMQGVHGRGIGGDIQIRNVIELDGEPIKEWTKSWQSEEVAVTNGR